MFLTIRNYAKVISRIMTVAVVFIIIFQLYFILTNADRIGAKNGNKIQAEKIRKELYNNIQTRYASKNPDDKILADAYSYVMCGVTGELCEPNQKERYTEGTVASAVGNVVSIPFSNPPASGVAWVKNTLENAGIAPKTYAQGIGFTSLTSFQTIWKAMRDVTFLLLVIVIVVSGFIIMFNVPIGSKSSVTIEAMLPRLVITLLLITFSYAIAGLLIDVMYVAMILVVSLFAPIIQGSQGEYLSAAISGSPASLFSIIWWTPIANGDIWDVSRSLYNIVPSQIRYIIDSILYYGLGHILLAIGTSGTTGSSKVTKGLKSISKGLGTKVFGTQNPVLWELVKKLGSFGESAKQLSEKSTATGAEAGINFGVAATLHISVPLIVWFISMLIIEPLMAVFRSYFTMFFIFILLMIALLFTFFKVFAKLFSTYIDIILSVMFAPIYIVMNALPGNNSFTEWFKQLAINLLTFPMVMGIMLVVSYMTQFADTTEMWTPPFLTGIASQRAIQVIIAGTILFNTSSMIDKFREMLGYKKGFSMSPLTMLSPWIALAGGVVGLSKSSQALNATWKKAGGMFGQATKATGAGTGGDGI